MGECCPTTHPRSSTDAGGTTQASIVRGCIAELGEFLGTVGQTGGCRTWAFCGADDGSGGVGRWPRDSGRLPLPFALGRFDNQEKTISSTSFNKDF